jgi:hypothetical protein
MGQSSSDVQYAVSLIGCDGCVSCHHPARQDIVSILWGEDGYRNHRLSDAKATWIRVSLRRAIPSVFGCPLTVPAGSSIVSNLDPSALAIIKLPAVMRHGRRRGIYTCYLGRLPIVLFHVAPRSHRDMSSKCAYHSLVSVMLVCEADGKYDSFVV